MIPFKFILSFFLSRSYVLSHLIQVFFLPFLLITPSVLSMLYSLFALTSTNFQKNILQKLRFIVFLLTNCLIFLTFYLFLFPSIDKKYSISFNQRFNWSNFLYQEINDSLIDVSIQFAHSLPVYFVSIAMEHFIHR